MDECAKRGIGIVMAGAFNSGILAKARKQVGLRRCARRHRRTAVEARRGACGGRRRREPAGGRAVLPAGPSGRAHYRLRRAHGEQITANIGWFEEPVPSCVLDAAEGAGAHRRRRSGPRPRGGQGPCGSTRTSISGGSPIGRANGRRPTSRRSTGSSGPRTSSRWCLSRRRRRHRAGADDGA